MSVRTVVIATLLAGLAVPPTWGEDFNPIVAKNNAYTLRESDLDRLIASQPPESRKQLEEKPELKVTMARELLMKMAIAARARQEGFDRKPEIREKLGYVVDDFLTREYLDKVVTAGITVPEEALEKYYKEHEKDFVIPRTVKARHIYIQLAANASAEERAQAGKKAEELLQRLKKGEDFAKLAAEASQDEETAKKGGDLGVISPGKTNSEEFEEAALRLKPGELSGIVTTPYGLHIIRADERNEQHPATFAEARGYIVNTLQKEYEQKKARDFVEKMIKESGLEVYADRITGTRGESGMK
jgi:peptidyl-prolyl cis-trans isomerase C